MKAVECPFVKQYSVAVWKKLQMEVQSSNVILI